MKKAILFTPYADVFSGGEQYFYSVASLLNKLGLNVVIAWHQDLADRIKDYFGINLSGVVFSPALYRQLVSSRQTRKTAMSQYDLSFWVSDGSLPTLYAKTNYLHYQVPFTHSLRGLKSRFKARSISRAICNSSFTAQVIARVTPFAHKISVIYPYINLAEFDYRANKQPTILSVGTIGGRLHSKRQDILIEAFRQFIKIHPDWQLILVGRVEDQAKLTQLHQQAQGLPVRIMPSVTRLQLRQLYAVSSLYWHAAGFGLNPKRQPEKMEHFGISIIESLAAGCVPLCYRGGEMTTLLTPDLLYQTQAELLDKTLIQLGSLGHSRSTASHQLAQQFDYHRFADSLKSLLIQDNL